MGKLAKSENVRKCAKKIEGVDWKRKAAVAAVEKSITQRFQFDLKDHYH